MNDKDGFNGAPWMQDDIARKLEKERLKERARTRTRDTKANPVVCHCGKSIVWNDIVGWYHNDTDLTLC